MNRLYNPKSGPMNVFVLFSGGASSLRAMLDDPNYGKLYRVVGALTDIPQSAGAQVCRDSSIDCLAVDRESFYRDKNLDPRSSESRKGFYKSVCEQMKSYKPHIVALCGYMHIISDPLLTEYHNRILNVHPTDLTILSGNGVSRLNAAGFRASAVRAMMSAKKLSPKFKGGNAVRDAILVGEVETRSTVHVARERFDEGPILVQSKPFAFSRMESIGRAEQYAKEAQEIMKHECDGPAYCKALQLLAEGRLGIEFDTVFLDGKRLPYRGFRLEG